MSVQWTSPVSFVRNGRNKRIDSDEPVSKCPRLSESSTDAGYLSSSPGSPVWAAPFSGTQTHQGPSRIGQFLLIPIADRDGVHTALNVHSGEESVCKVFDMVHYQEKIRAHSTLPPHKNISRIKDIILGDRKAYVFLEKDYGDMHMFVKSRKKLDEDLAARLFYQVASAVAHCHQMGIVLGDLKLRKFVFSNEKRTHLKLESLEDCHVLQGDSDSMSDKHGCPAYVSPEILNCSGTYSGKQADVWSLGVMLYTLLMGRYPFHDSDPSALFSKIRRGSSAFQTASPEGQVPDSQPAAEGPVGEANSRRYSSIHGFRVQRKGEVGEPEANAADQTVPVFCMENNESLFC